MTKFAKALRQARQDAALATNGSLPLKGAPRPPAAPPRTDVSPDLADEHLVSLVSPAAFEAEQYRALRHIVEQMHKTANVTVVAVSSPAVGDGKTTTAINLAGALAQSLDARVLLIDADVRRPAVGPLLRHPGGEPGLVEAIVDPARTLDEVLVARPQFNLSFIPAGAHPPNRPYELLKSARLGQLLEEARQRFDYIVVDTPPLAAVQDCRLIARWVDGFLVVVAANRTPRRLVEEALGIIEPAKIFGLIFNGDRERGYINHYPYRDGPVYGSSARSDGRGARSGAPGARWRWRRRGEPA